LFIHLALDNDSNCLSVCQSSTFLPFSCQSMCQHDMWKKNKTTWLIGLRGGSANTEQPKRWSKIETTISK